MLIDVLMQDTAFHDCTKKARITEGGEFVLWQEAHREPSGLLEITVYDGTITLEGHVPSPSHKHLVEAIAWWIRGCRDVVNRLEVISPRDDMDDEITDAPYLVLEKDPLVKADQLRVATRDRVVTLEGLLTNEMDKRAAEADAWYLAGIEGGGQQDPGAGGGDLTRMMQSPSVCSTFGSEWRTSLTRFF